MEVSQSERGTPRVVRLAPGPGSRQESDANLLQLIKPTIHHHANQDGINSTAWVGDRVPSPERCHADMEPTRLLLDSRFQKKKKILDSVEEEELAVLLAPPTVAST